MTNNQNETNTKTSTKYRHGFGYYALCGIIGTLTTMIGIGTYLNWTGSGIQEKFDGKINGKTINYYSFRNKDVINITKNDTTYNFIDNNLDQTPDQLNILYDGEIVEQYKLHSYESYTAMNNKADSVYKKTLEEITKAKENYVPTGLKGL